MGSPRLEQLIARYGLKGEVVDALRAWDAEPRFPDDPDTADFPDDVDGPALPPRYVYQDLLGVGGMGEVIRVRDTVLERPVAMKILRTELMHSSRIASRFEDEAIATAQLEHPGIVPVHDYGVLPDGRAFFTMQEIKGDTLTAVAYPVHVKTHRKRRWARSKAGWTLTRLLDAFRQACQAVAHAHDRGVLHRDLKPDNLMIGSFGEVLVVDWGLAKVGTGPEAPVDGVTLKRQSKDSMRTRLGTVAGTPAFMPPEQAHGRIDQLAPPTDVYALGSILYFLLAGRPPYEGDAQTVLDNVRRGPPKPLLPLAPVPDALKEICAKAMSRDPIDRYADAGALAEALLAYEDGVARREKALALVRDAQDALPTVWSLRERADLAERNARRLAAEVKPWQPTDEKQALWTAEDEARDLGAEAELAEFRTAQLLRGALTHAPELPEAHAVLADLYRQRHEEAERNRDASAARRYALLLAEHDRVGAHTQYLRGDGTVTLHTDVPASVQCLKYVERGRRLVAEPYADLGTTPLEGVPLERGSYLLRLTAPGRIPVDYPVFIERQTHWDGRPPGHDAPLPIRLPEPDDLEPGEVYVPAGWFWYGGRNTLGGHEGQLERRWVDSFLIQRDPVTNGDYLAFLNALVDAGREDDALACVPRHRGDSGASIYGRDGRHFALVPDSDGDIWDADWPALLVSWDAANAYASWQATQSGRPIRLPYEVEWEKAGRGVDRRLAPWGDHLEPTWAAVRGSTAGRALPARIGAHPIDVSPYGVRGLGGNSGDWCLDEIRPGMRAYRGGAWSYPMSFCELPARRHMAPTSRAETIGVRTVRTLPVDGR